MSLVAVGRHFAPLYSQRALRMTGLFGVVGSLLAAAGDFATAYTLAPPPAMNTVPWLSFPEFAEFVAPQSQLRLLVGHYLGVLFIPLNVLGMWHIYLALAPGGRGVALIFLGAGSLLAVIGAAFHGMVGLAVTVIRAGDPATSTHAVAYIEPFAWMLTLVGSALFLLLAVSIWQGRSAFPRWMAWVSPLPGQLGLTLAAHVTPLAVSVLLVVCGFNLSVLLFFIISTIRLWHHDPLRPAQ